MSLSNPACDALYVAQGAPDRNLAASPLMVVGYSGRDGAGYLVGLLQFPPLDLGPGYGVLSARLYMKVYRAAAAMIPVAVYANQAPFDGRTVTFSTRPAIVPYPVSCLYVPRESAESYVACDITQYLQNRPGRLPGFGFSLVSVAGYEGVAAFYAMEEACLPFVQIICRSMPDPDRGGGLMENVFAERVFDVQGMGEDCYTPAIRMAEIETATFFMKNNGPYPAILQLQLSPDGLDFLPDKQLAEAGAGELAAVTPYLFGKFMRAQVRPARAGLPVSARVWYQAQTRNYMAKERPEAMDGLYEGSCAMELSTPRKAARKAERSNS